MPDRHGPRPTAAWISRPWPKKTPERIFTTRLDGCLRVWPYQAQSLFFGCGLTQAQVGEGVKLLQGAGGTGRGQDATLVEINPLAVTGDGHLVALDAKMNFDESGLKRNPDIAALEDPEEGDPLERKGQEMGVNYVRLDGYVGTMVNGAGLAMATMDAIKQAGALPALSGCRRRPARKRWRPAFHHAVGPQGPRHPHQHLRRDPALRHRGRGWSTPPERSTSSCRW